MSTRPTARDALAPRRALVERARERLLRTSSPRLHASLIVALSGLTAFLSSAAMLRAGVDGMTTRYTIAAVMGYLAFVGLIRGWIGLHRRSGGNGSGPQVTDVVDVMSGGGRAARGSSIGFGGGHSGGGGASGSFVPSSPSSPLAQVRASGGASSRSSSGSWGSGFSLDLDELAWVVLAIALAFIGVVAVAYVIYVAPLLLAEVALDAALLGGAYRGLRRQDAQHWATGVLRKTAIPALIVIVCAAGIGYCGQRLAPGARSIGGVVRALRH